MENKLSKSELIQAPTGTKDILPEDAAKWRAVESAVHEVARLFGYGEIRTPSFEQLRLFKRAVGEETDIVSKEMFLLQSRNEDKEYALRPELTAPVVRAAIEHGMLTGQSDCVKLYYCSAPNFRYEKPQRGRLRQFHQFGTELLGPSSPLSDAETISFALSIFQKLNVRNPRLRLNSLGSKESREAWKQELVPYLREHSSKLSEDSQRRTETNPLRVLDSKAPEDQDIIQSAPKINDYLSVADKSHFELVGKLFEIIFPIRIIDDRLVRGIDYYSGTVFEITSDDLGAQDALCGGGRYDNLVEQLGGYSTPAVGFGGGMERLLMVSSASLEQTTLRRYHSKIYVIANSDDGRIEAFHRVSEFRSAGIVAMQDLNGRSMKAQMREADKLGANLVYIIGESELLDDAGMLKEMQSGEQTKIKFDSILEEVKKRLS